MAHALIRLAVTGRVEETGGRYALGRQSRPFPDGSAMPDDADIRAPAAGIDLAEAIIRAEFQAGSVRGRRDPRRGRP